jgi:hypothetical protein
MGKEQPKPYVPSKYEETQAENVMTEKQKQLTSFRENKKEEWEKFGIEELSFREAGRDIFYYPPEGTRGFQLKGVIKGHKMVVCYYDYRGTRNGSTMGDSGRPIKERYSLSIDGKEVEDQQIAKELFEKYEKLATGIGFERKKVEAMKEVKDYHNEVEKEEKELKEIKDAEVVAEDKKKQEAVIQELLG